jgi:hypothetical protein
MTLLVFCLLAVLWGAVFIPAIVRARLDSSPIATVGTFRRGMSALGAQERTFEDGRWILVPPTTEQLAEARRRSLARHRQFLSWLVLGAVVTLSVGLLPGLHVLLKAHLLVDAAILVHLVFLVKTRRKRLELGREMASSRQPASARQRVPARQPVPEPSLMAPMASMASAEPVQRMVIPDERRRASRPARRDRIVDIRTDTGARPDRRSDTREALYVFHEDEEEHGYLKAGQF